MRSHNAPESRAHEAEPAHKVRADFDGTEMIVETSGGRFLAPRDVQPENPWSLRFTRASTVLSPETGELSAVQVSDLGYESIDGKLSGATVRHYLIRGEVERHLYFDRSGTPVKLIYPHSTGRVTLVRIDAMPSAEPPETASIKRGEGRHD